MDVHMSAMKEPGTAVSTVLGGGGAALALAGRPAAGGAAAVAVLSVMLGVVWAGKVAWRGRGGPLAGCSRRKWRMHN